MKNIFVCVCCICFLIGCKSKKINEPSQFKKADTALLDYIKKNSDSSYTKKYPRTDFAKAEYFLFKKDTSICQVMKDTAGQVRQIIISKKNTRIYFAQFFANGQLMEDVKLNSYGQYNGKAIMYYENGKVKSNGNYTHGLSTGNWQEYNEDGHLSATIKYDNNGVRKK